MAGFRDTYSLTGPPQLSVIFTHCCCGQSLLVGVPMIVVAKREESRQMVFIVGNIGGLGR